MTFDLAALEPIRKTAERLDRHPRTILEWSKIGVLPQPEKFRGRYYYPRDVKPVTNGK